MKSVRSLDRIHGRDVVTALNNSPTGKDWFKNRRNDGRTVLRVGPLSDTCSGVVVREEHRERRRATHRRKRKEVMTGREQIVSPNCVSL